MGMSASQVRFLSLQHRKHDVGRQLTALSNRKQALSRDMNKVAKNYTEALNQNVLKWSNDSGMTYQNLTYDLMMKPNDYNFEVPYIVSTRDGKAVVDKAVNLLGKRNGEYVELTGATIQNGPMAGKELNYTNLAKWITTAENLEGKTGQLYTTTDGFEAGTKNVNSYIIPDKAPDYGFEHTLRYQIFQELGLVDEQTTRDYNKLLTQLYGSEGAKEFGNYSELLAKYDFDKRANLLDDANYDDIFGRLSFDATDGFSFGDTGCALGNLALAKAYKKEYEDYLETPLNRDILADTKQKLCASTESDTNWLDRKSTNYYPEYKVNEDEQTGLAFRMIDLLSVTEGSSRIAFDGSTYKLVCDGVLNHTNLYGSDGTQYNTIDLAITNGAALDGTLVYDQDNSGQFDTDADLNAILTWANVFDYNGKYDTNGSGDYAGTYDKNEYGEADYGYFMGSDYIDNHNNNVTGLVLKSNGFEMDCDESLGDAGKDNWCYFSSIVDSLAASFSTIENINAQAVTKALNMTKTLYKTADDTSEESDGSFKGAKAARRATSVCDDIFGLGWCNKFGSDWDGSAISLTNVMNVFITLYQMYDKVNCQDSRISTSNKPTLKRNITAAANLFDSSIQKDLNSGAQPLLSVYESWNNISGTLTQPTSTPGASGAAQTITFEKDVPSFDDAGNPTTEKERITVNGVWNGTTFTKIFSCSEQVQDSNGVWQTESSYTYDDSAKTVTQTSSIGTVLYKQGVNAEITLTSGSAFTDGIRKIFIANDGSGNFKIQQMRDAYGNNFSPDSAPSNYMTSSATWFVMDPEVSGAQDSENLYELVLHSPNDSKFASVLQIKPEDKYGAQLDALVDECQRKVDELLDKLENFFSGRESKLMDYYDAIFLRISEQGWVSDPGISGGPNSQTYINNKLQNNDYFVAQCKAKVKGGGYTYTNKQAVNIMKIFQVRDEDAENVALATYESEKAAISVKERAVDARMQKLETEQEVINTELESIKKVRNDNIDKYFKIFA